VSTSTLVAPGNSLTAGNGSTGGQTYPAQLATASGRSVLNLGVSSQRAPDILARIGAIPMIIPAQSG
jgi:hypothetical protein